MNKSLDKSFLIIALLVFLMHCLKAERSPFDMNNHSNPIGSIILTLPSGVQSNTTATSSNPSFSYSQTSFTSYTGTSLSIAAPTVSSGSISSFSISPNLPIGLTLDATSGAISGIATGSASNQTYTITGKGDTTSPTTTLTIKIGSTAASGVLGQTGFTQNGGGASATLFSGPYDMFLDKSGNIYVADSGNNRALLFLAGSSSATTVFGQLGNFSSNVTNNGGISADSLNAPRGITVDNSGNVFITDQSNNRVLVYAPGSTTASTVYGQLGAFNTSTINNGGVTANSMAGPYRSTVDANGNLYVPNIFAHRVLFYPSGSTTATRVYGQFGSLTASVQNNGGVSADSLNAPAGTAVDASGNLYIADRQNNRVLFYPSGSTTATRVYGQLGSFTTNTVNNGGVSADSLNAPTGLTLDSSGNLYVADSVNNRVLYYPVDSTTATRVYGQLDSFTSNTANNGGITASSLNTPYAVAVDSKNNKLYVVDNGNNRIVIFYVP